MYDVYRLVLFYFSRFSSTRFLNFFNDPSIDNKEMLHIQYIHARPMLIVAAILFITSPVQMWKTVFKVLYSAIGQDSFVVVVNHNKWTKYFCFSHYHFSFRSNTTFFVLWYYHFASSYSKTISQRDFYSFFNMLVPFYLVNLAVYCFNIYSAFWETTKI